MSHSLSFESEESIAVGRRPPEKIDVRGSSAVRGKAESLIVELSYEP